MDTKYIVNDMDVPVSLPSPAPVSRPLGDKSFEVLSIAFVVAKYLRAAVQNVDELSDCGQ